MLSLQNKGCQRMQVGDLVIDERGIAVKGLLIRHLVMPDNTAGTYAVLKFIAC